jgi:type IV pilus assembly protein PilE
VKGQFNRSRPSREGGFTLIELMTVIVIIAILATIAISTYSNYITRSKIQAAKGDLSALALNLENELQAQLQYGTHNTTTTADTVTAYPFWRPAEGTDFVYTVNSSSVGYVLTATGVTSAVSTCVLALPSQSMQQQISPNATGSVSGCGSVTTW